MPSMYCTHWFNTIFAYSLPFEQLLRVWDVFLLEGLKVCQLMVYATGLSRLVVLLPRDCGAADSMALSPAASYTSSRVPFRIGVMLLTSVEKEG